MLSVQDVLFYLFVFFGSFTLVTVICEWIRSRGNLKKFDKFVKDVAIGKKYISYINLKTDDPFKENEQNVYVIVRGVKYNDNGDMWVKIEWQDGEVATMPVIELYYNFYEDESSNRG